VALVSLTRVEILVTFSVSALEDCLMVILWLVGRSLVCSHSYLPLLQTCCSFDVFSHISIVICHPALVAVWTWLRNVIGITIIGYVIQSSFHLGCRQSYFNFCHSLIGWSIQYVPWIALPDDFMSYETSHVLNHKLTATDLFCASTFQCCINFAWQSDIKSSLHCCCKYTCHLAYFLWVYHLKCLDVLAGCA